MTPASLSPALFTAAPATTTAAIGDAPLAGDAAGTGNPAFSGLLQASTGGAAADAGADNTAVLPADALASIDTLPAFESDAAAEDAPWPPAGLEQLLAPMATPATPAPAPSALAGALAAGAQHAQQAADADAGSQAALAAAPRLTSAPALAALGMPAPTAAATAANPQPADAGTSMPASLALPSAASPRDTAGSVNLPAPAIDSGSFAPLLGMTASTGTASTAATAIAPPLLPGGTELGSGQLEQDLAQGVDYMLDHKLQSARIRVAPEQLGSIDIELRLEGERVHAHFSSAHADVRQALSESLPRLRELLDQHGMQMGQAGVGSQSTDGTGNGQAHAPAAAPHGSAGNDGSSGDNAQPPPVWRRAGLLDTYA